MTFKQLFVGSVFSLFCASASAQYTYTVEKWEFEKGLSIGVSAGNRTINLEDNEPNIDIDYHYKNCYSLNVARQRVFKGIALMTEYRLGYGKFDKVEFNKKPKVTDAIPGEPDDIWHGNVAVYLGGVFNKGKRFQVPLYGGGGIEYMKGGIFHHFLPYVGMKIRTTYYITYKTAIYLGYNYQLAYGSKQWADDYYHSIHSRRSYFDAGIILTLKNKDRNF